jgi:prepilin-type processing-associated H-X9-DG protein
MSTLDEINSKITDIFHKYYHSLDSIICDNGRGNVLMVDGGPLQFDFTDSYEMGERGDIEEEKIKFLNDVMEIFYEFKHHVEFINYEEIGPWQSMNENEEDPGCATELDLRRLKEENEQVNPIGEVLDGMNEMTID